MFRIRLHLDESPQPYRYLDSIHAALVAGLTAGGFPRERLIGSTAAPWTFATKGFAKVGGVMTLRGLLISTADEALAGALESLTPEAFLKVSSNGDIIDLRRAKVRPERRGPAPTADEICVTFASRFALTAPKTGREKTRFVFSPEETSFSDAIRTNLTGRARKSLDLDVGIDRLTLMTEGKPRMISLRQAGLTRVQVPAFSMPVTLRGAPEDVRWAYFAGIGAKTHLGFGCPILPN